MPLVSPYANNATTPAQLSVAGFKISKPGYDARRTQGGNYVFNSSWPSLPIAFETTVTGTGSLMQIAHGLKFPAFTMAWTSYSDPSGVGTVGVRSMPMVDATYVYLTTVAARVYKVRCFNLDLSRDIDYTLAPGDTFNMPYDNNFGIKFVKQGKDINSRDMRDYVIHSRCQSPLILAVKTERTIPTANLATGIGNVIQYTSKLSYPVWVYGYIKVGAVLAASLGVATNTYVSAPYYAQGYPRTFTDGITAYIGYQVAINPDNGATLVMLRDPMFAATQTTVQY